MVPAEFNLLIFATCLITIMMNPSRDNVETEMKQLPSFAADFSELFVAAVVEKSFVSEDLYLSMIMMGHSVLYRQPQMPFLMINNSDTLLQWKAAARMWNKDRTVDTKHSGLRCAMHNAKSKAFDIKGSGAPNTFSSTAHWAPSETVGDERFNKAIEMLRCKIDSALAYEVLPGERKSVVNSGLADILIVEIQRLDAEKGRKSLITFTVAWKSRCSGYGCSSSRRDSRWDGWSPWNRPKSTSKLKKQQLQKKFQSSPSDHLALNVPTPSTPTAVLCLSYVRPLEPFRMDGIVMLLENIQHNLQIGFDHIFLSVALDSDSIHMQRIRLAVSSFVRSNRLSLSSFTFAGIDDATGFLGMQLIDDFARWINQMVVLYLAKGVVDYVAYLTPSEFITVKPPMMTIQDVLQWSNVQLTDSMGRVPCYFVLETLGVPDPPGVLHGFGPGDVAWTSSFFAKAAPRGPLPGWANIVVPTRNVWLVAWHFCGGCLKYPVNISTGSNFAAALSETTVVASKSVFNLDGNDGQMPMLDESKMSHVHTPGDQGVLQTTHGGMVPPTVANVYFYKGKLDPWHYKRAWYTHNDHIELFAAATARALAHLGFSLEQGVLTYRVRCSLVRKLYPAYYDHILASICSQNLNQSTIVDVKLSCVRTQAYECVMPYFHRLKDNAAAPKIITTPSGKPALLAQGSWMECNQASKCRVPIDIISPSVAP